MTFFNLQLQPEQQQKQSSTFNLFGSKPKDQPSQQKQLPATATADHSKGFGLVKNLKDSLTTSTTTTTGSNKQQVENKKVVELNNKKNTGDLQRGMTGATPGHFNNTVKMQMQQLMSFDHKYFNMIVEGGVNTVVPKRIIKNNS